MADSKAGSRPTGMNIDTALVRELAEMLADTGLTEIEVEDGDRKIKVSRGGGVAPVFHSAPAPVAAPAAAPAAAAAPAPAAPAAPANDPNAVKSPMVGTAYMAPEPGAAEQVRAYMASHPLFLTLVHEVATQQNKEQQHIRTYYHRFVLWHAATGHITHATDPFVFVNLHVEMATGLMLSPDQQHVLVLLGWEDCTVHTMSLSLNSVCARMHTLEELTHGM